MLRWPSRRLADHQLGSGLGCLSPALVAMFGSIPTERQVERMVRLWLGKHRLEFDVETFGCKRQQIANQVAEEIGIFLSSVHQHRELASSFHAVKKAFTAATFFSRAVAECEKIPIIQHFVENYALLETWWENQIHKRLHWAWDKAPNSEYAPQELSSFSEASNFCHEVIMALHRCGYGPVEGHHPFDSHPLSPITCPDLLDWRDDSVSELRKGPITPLWDGIVPQKYLNPQEMTSELDEELEFLIRVDELSRDKTSTQSTKQRFLDESGLSDRTYRNYKKELEIQRKQVTLKNLHALQKKKEGLRNAPLDKRSKR